MLGLISKGIVIGVLVSAPMGPIGMLCIQRTLNKGRWHGFVTGLGAALSDVIYAALTCLGMGVVVNFVEANQAPLQLIGSIVLGIFGYYIFQSNPVRNLRKQREKKLSFTQDFITAFLLTFSNYISDSEPPENSPHPNKSNATRQHPNRMFRQDKTKAGKQTNI